MSQILGVKIDSVIKTEARQQAEIFLLGNGQKKIFTPNPEMLVLAQKDAEFKNILNSGDLNLCDGFGIQLVSGFKIKRLTGVDFVLELCGLAEVLGKSVFLLGTGDRAVLNLAEINLQTKFPSLKIVGSNVGPKIDLRMKNKDLRLNHVSQSSIFNLQSSLNILENQMVIDEIDVAKPDILFVAFGQVKQEKWINEFLPKLPSVKIAMGVGGSLDYISGHVSRAPLFFRQIGLEWVYRLAREPKRFGRIFNATVKFLYFYAREKTD